MISFLWLLLSVTTANAAFEIGFTIVSALLPASAAITGALVTTVGNVVLAVGAIALSALTSQGGARRQTVQPQEAKNTFEGGESSEIRAIGRVRVGGLIAYGNTSGVVRYRLMAHTKGLWTADELHYLGGREVVVAADGAVSSPPWVFPGGSYVFVSGKDGDGTETAWPTLVAAFPGIWTTAHKLIGVHQSLLTYVSPGISTEKFLTLYQAGEPAYEKVGRAEPVYDPRDGGQSPTDATTWTWDDNAILCAAHVLRTDPSIASTDLNYADIALEATKADVLVNTLVGTEPRAALSGVWPSESPRGEIMEQILRSAGAEIVPMDDSTVTIRFTDDNPTPEITFLEKHVLGIKLSTGPESVQRPNTARVRYYSPERNYDFADINLASVAWARIPTEIARVGEQIESIELPFCSSYSQAQRIARQLFLVRRADSGVVTLNFAGLAAWGLRFASLPFPDIGVNGATVWKTCKLGTPRVDDNEGTVEIPFIVWPQELIDNPWDYTTMEAPAPEQIPDLQYESELDSPNAPSEAIYVQYPGGAREIRVEITPVGGATTAEGNFRQYSGGFALEWEAMTSHSLNMVYKTGDYAGDELDFRIRYFNIDGDASYFSPLLEIASLGVDDTFLQIPVLSVTGTNGNWDVEGTIGGDINSTSAKLQYRTYASGFPPAGAWIDFDTRNIRPSDNYSVNTSAAASSGDTIAIRLVAFTTNLNETPSLVFEHDEP